MSNNGSGNNDLVAGVDGVVYPLSDEECIFRARATGEKHVMTLQVLRALDLCSFFRTMDDHVRAVMQAIPELQGREDDVRRVLGALRNRGLFEHAENALARLNVEEQRPAPVAGLMVRSAGRPEALGRLLDSLSRLNAHFHTEYGCTVFDDAADEEAAADCERVCERFRAEGLDVAWRGRAWQREYVDDLQKRAGVEPSVVDWLLGPADRSEQFSGGRVWNLILLAAAGRRFIMVDDDIVLEPRAMDSDGTVSLDADQWQVWFHGSEEEAAGAGEAMDTDPIARHLDFLGRPVRNALAEAAGSAERLGGIDQRQLESLDYRSPVIATVSGTYGDAASGSSNLWFFTLTGPSRDRLVASRDDYDRNRNTRWVTRVRGASNFRRRSNFTQNGMDGSRLLPPTLPAGRNEDKFQQSLTGYMYPGARVLEFPWAFGHFPESPRHWSTDPLKTPMGAGLASFLADTLSQHEDRMPGSEPGTRLRLAAEMLGDMARRSDAALTERLDEYLIYVRSNLVQLMQRQLAEYPDAPVYWAADVRAIIETNGKALTGDAAPLLQEMPSDADAAVAAAWLRDRLGQLSGALHAWPSLHEAAREAAEDGR